MTPDHLVDLVKKLRAAGCSRYELRRCDGEVTILDILPAVPVDPPTIRGLAEKIYGGSDHDDGREMAVSTGDPMSDPATYVGGLPSWRRVPRQQNDDGDEL